MHTHPLPRVGGIVVGSDESPMRRSARTDRESDDERQDIGPRHHGAREIAIGVAERLGAPLQLEPFAHTSGDRRRHLEPPGSGVRPTYRSALHRQVAATLQTHGPCLHLSIQAFPIEAVPAQRTDVAVLFDPSRPPESAIAARLVAELRRAGLRAAPNTPSLPPRTSLTQWLRGQLQPADYAGIDIACSDGVLLDPSGPPRVARALARAVRAAVEVRGATGARHAGRDSGDPWREETAEFPTGDRGDGGRSG